MSMPVEDLKDEQIIAAALLELADRLLPTMQPGTLAVDLTNGAAADLFNGKAGIIVFYLRLAAYDPAYLAVCTSAADVLLEHPAILQQEFFTLYTGATSLVYLCIQLYEATSDKRYLERGLALVYHYREGILQKVVQDDFISGHAGNLLVLTQLHAYTKDDVLRTLIRQLADKLIAHARIASQGLRWGHLKRSYDCLTGLSHGASGIAHALLQVATYFEDEGLHYLAMQAWAYEMKYYDPGLQNWLDLRLTSTSLEEEDIMGWQLTDFRRYISDVNAWAHGAAGIGLSRMYAWKTSGEVHFATACEWALTRCIRDAGTLTRGDFTLCSGYGGVGMFLLQAAAVLNRPVLRQTAKQIALAAIRYYEVHGTYNSYIKDAQYDPGLFSGLAGVGYFFVSVLLPYRAHTVMAPLINMDVKHSPLYEKGAVKRALFSRYYERSLQRYPGAMAARDINELEMLLGEGMEDQDCFGYEKSLADTWRSHGGWLCYQQRNQLLEKRNGYLLQEYDRGLLQTVFMRVPELTVCVTKRAWHDEANTVQQHNTQCHYVHVAHVQGVSTFPVNQFTAILLAAFSRELPLQQVITDIICPQVDVSMAALQEAVLSQIKVLLRQYMITQKQTRG
ncbi:Lanthionine synthetase C-like protein [Chitinophaga sp. YR627]|uniref:lanthionine synthetase LanC family protein n=1 Tax=Chitinophaga sp. YR627 TaxID=1881041 RepID=UPI0008EFD4DA|nr:lanthionine synthetase LanC family protein [Chitinophaga sp. YR627]SFM58342.1 Lanthionine synthetase C-like protein [Chitinophaga sp. YR627]